MQKQRHAQNVVSAALSSMAKDEKSTRIGKHTKKLRQTTFLQSVFGQKQQARFLRARAYTSKARFLEVELPLMMGTD